MHFFATTCLFLFTLKTFTLPLVAGRWPLAAEASQDSVKVCCDDRGWLYINGKFVKFTHGQHRIITWYGNLKVGDTVLIMGKYAGGGYGCSALVSYRGANGTIHMIPSGSKYWRARPVTSFAHADLLKAAPISGWPSASKGQALTKVHPHSEIMWADKPQGMALMATTLDGGPADASQGSEKLCCEATFRCDDHGWLYINGKFVKFNYYGWKKTTSWYGHLKAGDTVVIKGSYYQWKFESNKTSYGCSAFVSYRGANGTIHTIPSGSKYWRAHPLAGRLAYVDLPVFLKKMISGWPSASKGQARTKILGAQKVAQNYSVHRDSEIMWGDKPQGVALMATTLGGGPVTTGSVAFVCDDAGWLFINYKLVKSSQRQNQIATWYGNLNVGDTVMITAMDKGGRYGCSALVAYRVAKGPEQYIHTDSVYWRALPYDGSSWQTFMRKNPMPGWPAASKGTGSLKVHAKSRLIWAAKPGGIALVATTIGSPPVSLDSGDSTSEVDCEDHSIVENSLNLSDFSVFGDAA